MKVLTIHGIRRQNRWNESLSNLQRVKENNIEIVPFDFGFFRFVKFIWPFTREKIVDNFCEFYSNNFTNSTEVPSVVAHSFGTYIVLMSMKRHKHIKFKTIIFCGSILNSKIDFRDLISNSQFEKLFNDHGKREWYLKITRVLINKNCGQAGKKGFLDIPRNNEKMIINRNNYYRHSDYFLEINMDKEWVTELIKAKIKISYKSSILRKEVIERIYKNLNNSNFPFKINSAVYCARVDRERNYYAKSTNQVLNNTKLVIDSYSFSTTADGTNEANEMNFFVYDSNQNKLIFTIEQDEPNHKTINVSLHKQMRVDTTETFDHYFMWDKTITFNGDTDHWIAKNIRNLSIKINFPFKLTNPRFFIVNSKDIIEQHSAIYDNELDSTFTYKFEYDNVNNYDGIIFYFEGHIPSNNKATLNVAKIHNSIKKRTKGQAAKNLITVEKAKLSEIEQIFEIEQKVEHRNAATHEVLTKRLNTFNDGFLTIKLNNKIVSYLESVIWNQKSFETFEEISNFPMHYNVKGNGLYIIFLATHPSHRKKGYATKLLTEIEIVAKKYNIQYISLVAKDDLKNFYSKFGFSEQRELPNFLKNKNYKSILMRKNIV